MKAPTHTTFDALPDVALIQIRPLLNYKVVPYSATTIWRLCRDGKFPRPIKISSGITAWKVGDIREYLKTVCSTPKGDAS
jgi:prophage regulatory protein